MVLATSGTAAYRTLGPFAGQGACLHVPGMTGGLALALALASTAVGRGGPAPTRPLGPGEVWLPVSRIGELCAGGGLDAFLRGSPADPRITWLENADGTRVEMLVGWPPEYIARFTPELEVLDRDGNVIGRDGWRVSGFSGAENGALLEPLLPADWWQRGYS